jgi:2'-5' RNA ligase
VRLFFAVEISQAVVDGVSVVIDRLRAQLSHGASFTRPTQVHVTLQFLGEVDEAREKAATEVARAIEMPAFDFVVAGAGAFPSDARPSVLWLGVQRGEALIALADDLAARLRAGGFALDDRKYHPHLTLARIKDRRVQRRASEALRSIEWEPQRVGVDRFVLYESRGGAYHERAAFPLQKPNAQPSESPP